MTFKGPISNDFKKADPERETTQLIAWASQPARSLLLSPSSEGEEKVNRRYPIYRDRIPRDWGYHLGIAHITICKVVRLCPVLTALIPTNSEESETS